MSAKERAKAKAACVCKTWVTGGLEIRIGRDDEGRAVSVDVPSWPRRTAVSKKFVERMNQAVPGSAEWSGGRLLIRTPREERAYRKVQECPCGYIMVESA